MRQTTLSGMTWANETGIISQLAKQVPVSWWVPEGSLASPGLRQHQRAPPAGWEQRGLGGAVPAAWSSVRWCTAAMPHGPAASVVRGAWVGTARIQENKGAMALKFTQRSKKIMGSFIRIAVVLDHIVNDLFNLNIFHKESPYFHKYVIST